MDNLSQPDIANRYSDAIHTALECGRDILKQGGSALDAVESCAVMLEDNTLFNAGCGSVLNEDGKVEMDAAIMEGSELSAGAVAGVSNFANPVQLAHLVMTKSEHVLLIGEGVNRFAKYCGISPVPDSYFLIPERIEQLRQAQQHHKMLLDFDNSKGDGDEQKYSTIGAVARDLQGNLAAATSTGGITNKRIGRVGDSPIVGAGVYADNETCAVSATGYGEDFMRTVISKTISDFILMKDMNAKQATEAAIDYLIRKVKGRGGVIVIDKNGNCASGMTTKKMIHGWIENGGKINVCF